MRNGKRKMKTIEESRVEKKESKRLTELRNRKSRGRELSVIEKSELMKLASNRWVESVTITAFHNDRRRRGNIKSTIV